MTLIDVWTDFVSGSLTNTLSAYPADNTTQTMTSEGLRTLGLVTNGVHQAKITLDPFAVNGSPELVWVTAHAANSNTAQIKRITGQPLRQHLASETWVHGPTAEEFTAFRSLLNTFTYQCQQATVTGGPTSGSTELVIATLNIPSQLTAYQLECAAFWTAYNSVQDDMFQFRIKVDGAVKAQGNNRHDGAVNERKIYALPTSTLTTISASTGCTVTATIQRTIGNGTLTENNSGLLTARMSFFL